MSIHIKYLRVKDVDDFPYLGSLHLSKADTDAHLHHRISSASGVMPDSKEEFLVNRDIQVKNCLFTKQLFFPLQCIRHRPRSAEQLY